MNDLELEIKSMGDKWHKLNVDIDLLRKHGKELLERIDYLKEQSDISFKLYLMMRAFKCTEVEIKLRYYDMLVLSNTEFVEEYIKLTSTVDYKLACL